MDSYLIAFRLKKEEDYSKVSSRIRNYPKWARVMDNVWIVLSDSNLEDVRGSISSIINDSGGSILVVRINGASWGTFFVDKDVTDWMKENV